MKNQTAPHTQLLALVCSVFDAYAATLYLPCEEGGEYVLAAAFSLGDTSSLCGKISDGKGLAGWILRNNQPLVVPNFDEHQSPLGYYEDGEEASIKAFMGCPVPMGGVICVDSKRQYSFTDKDSKILQMFADIASRQNIQGLSNLAGDIPEYFAQLGIIQNLRFKHKRWPVFLHNFLCTIAGATKYDYCAFASLDPSGESYSIEGESSPTLLQHGEVCSLPIESGMVGWVFRDERQAVFSEGTSGGTAASPFGKVQGVPNFRAVICIPVIVNRAALGVVCLAHMQPRHMDEALRSFVHQCVDHLAIFLENLYLRNRLQELLPKAQLHKYAAPDANPQPHAEED